MEPAVWRDQGSRRARMSQGVRRWATGGDRGVVRDHRAARLQTVADGADVDRLRQPEAVGVRAGRFRIRLDARHGARAPARDGTRPARAEVHLQLAVPERGRVARYLRASHGPAAPEAAPAGRVDAGDRLGRGAGAGLVSADATALHTGRRAAPDNAGRARLPQGVRGAWLCVDADRRRGPRGI